MAEGISIYLDDSRKTPREFNMRCYWPEEVICLLGEKKGEVECISLDYNLEKNPESLGDHRKGVEVLHWIEKQVQSDPSFVLPRIIIHSRDKQMAPAMREKVIEISKMCEKLKNVHDKCISTG
jgi:hypothetical protein